MRYWWATAGLGVVVGLAIAWSTEDQQVRVIALVVGLALVAVGGILSLAQSLWHFAARRAFDSLTEDGWVLRRRLVDGELLKSSILDGKVELPAEDDEELLAQAVDAWYWRVDRLTHKYADSLHPKFFTTPRDDGTFHGIPRYRSDMALAMDAWLRVVVEIRAKF
jgi:hypothetical protein